MCPSGPRSRAGSGMGLPEHQRRVPALAPGGSCLSHRSFRVPPSFQAKPLRSQRHGAHPSPPSAHLPGVLLRAELGFLSRKQPWPPAVGCTREGGREGGSHGTVRRQRDRGTASEVLSTCLHPPLLLPSSWEAPAAQECPQLWLPTGALVPQLSHVPRQSARTVPGDQRFPVTSHRRGSGTDKTRFKAGLGACELVRRHVFPGTSAQGWLRNWDPSPGLRSPTNHTHMSRCHLSLHLAPPPP